MVRRSALALVAGVLLALCFPGGFPPGPLVWLVPVAVAAFFVLTDGLGVRRAWLPGLAFGLGFQVSLLWWMHVVGIVPWLALAGIQGAWYALLAAVVVPLRRLPLPPLWLAVAWVAMESVRCTWPAGGMPWGRLSYAVVGTPFAGALPYAGATGVSLLIALLGTLLARLARSLRPPAGEERPRDGWRAPLAATVAVVAVGLVPQVAPWSARAVGHVEVAAVQGNVPGNGTDVLDHYRQITANHVAETQQLAADVAAGRTPRPEFVVWPENSTAVDPFEDEQMRSDIATAVAAIDVPVLVGTVVDGGPRHVLNQGIVYNPVTGAGDRYTKWHPVPFGEFVPWRGLFGARFAQLNEVPRDMVGGTRVTPIEVAGVPVADAICFDVAYDDGLYAQLSHGGRLVVVQTSNAMFIHTSQIDQQFAISRLRALESGRYVVVAAMNGLTGVIAPDGSVVTQVAPRTRAYAEARVGLYDAVTPAVRLGEWPARGSLLVTAVACLVGLGRYRRRRRPAQPDRTPATAPADRIPA